MKRPANNYLMADLAATAVARQWLDWIPPTVTTLLLPFSIASARRNSSFLTWMEKQSGSIVQSLPESYAMDEQFEHARRTYSVKSHPYPQ